MMERLKLGVVSQDQKALINDLARRAETDISLCYQCGKCAAGCPAGFAMDYTPRQIIRLLQLGLVDEALKADSIWICAACETCSTRCPRGVNIAELMDTLRREAGARGINANNEVATFNQIFLSLVKKFGRPHEPSILLAHNLKVKKPFKDAELGLPTMKRGKAAIFPERIKGRDEVARIFDRVKAMGGEE